MGISTAAIIAAKRAAPTMSMVGQLRSTTSRALPLSFSTSTSSDYNRCRTSSSSSSSSLIFFVASAVGISSVQGTSGIASCDTDPGPQKPSPDGSQHRQNHLFPLSPVRLGSYYQSFGQIGISREGLLATPDQANDTRQRPVLGGLSPYQLRQDLSPYQPPFDMPPLPPVRLDSSSSPLPAGKPVDDDDAMLEDFPQFDTGASSNPPQLHRPLDQVALSNPTNPPQLGWPSLPTIPNQAPSFDMDDMNFEPMPDDLPIFGNGQLEQERHFGSDRIIHQNMPWALRNAQRALQTSRNQAQSAENAGIQAQSEISEQAQGPARRERRRGSSSTSIVGSTTVASNDEAAAITSRPARRERRRGSSSTSIVGSTSVASNDEGPSRKKQRRGHQSAPNPEAVAEQPEIQQAASSRTWPRTRALGSGTTGRENATGMDHMASLKTWVEEYGEERGDKHTLKVKDNGVTVALQKWVRKQRKWVQEYLKGTTEMDTMMYDALMSTGFNWEGVQYQEVSFDSRMESLREYIKEHGETPTQKLSTQRYPGLGPWLSRMRLARNGNKNLNISEAQFLMIDELLGEGWNGKQEAGRKPKDGKPKKG